MAVLVTGGTGYIGSHTAVSLIEAGFDVVIVDDLSNSSADVIDRIEAITGKRPELIVGDLTDIKVAESAFSRFDIDSVIHFAGLKAVGESVAQPLRYYDVNIGTALNVLISMQKFGVKKIVFSSSATVYSGDNEMPLREDAHIGASNPYGQTKVMIESILRDACAADKSLTAVLLRYFNPIGAHPSGLIGDDPNGIPNNLMPYILKVALKKLPYLHIYGTDYPTPDGTGVRDYIHVTDLAEGHIAALKFADSNTGAFAFNLGTGTGQSVFDVVNAFRATTGVDIPYRCEERRPGDLPVSCADPSLAREKLGWIAKLSLDDMMRDSWTFAKKTLDRK